MRTHVVRVHPSAETPPREEQLAWKIATVAADPAPLDLDAAAMVVNRIIDNAAVAIAAINRRPVACARAQALAHPRARGAAVFGLSLGAGFEAEWAAWANATAVRELDFHDTFLARDYAHPGDNIPPILAVAQQCRREGAELLRAIVAAYEVQIALAKGICLHAHRIDHVAHLGPSAAAGIGALLGLDAETIYQAVQHALHVSTATRQSRKGEISSWKATAPAHTGKLAIEAVDRAMRGECAPSPIYEGEDGVIAWMLDGPDAAYEVTLPEAGEPKRAILETYTKAHSAEYQSQALIDLAFRLRTRIPDTEAVDSIMIHTSRHTHAVIGTGSGDPQKFDPRASRETLDHSAMYIFAVALNDGTWHHVASYAPERAQRPDTVRLWRKIATREDPEWTRRYHSEDPGMRAFGARAEVIMADGSRIDDELAVADAHPAGAHPFVRADYVRKFETLTEGVIAPAESRRFLDLAQCVPDVGADGVRALSVEVAPGALQSAVRDDRGIF